ncbi:MAG: DNA primase [bacterium]
MDLKETILERVNIAELIGQFVTLVRSSPRELKACCPFHNEKTPSFYVIPEKKIYHCFGCKAGGNVIDFVMARENLDFREAMEWLAGRYGIEIQQYNPEQRREKSERQRRQELNQASQKFFSGTLAKPEGEVARKYLRKRGIDVEVAKHFELGYAPKEWGALSDMLLSKGVRGSELEVLSLAKSRNSGGGYYDFFRHRLIFPIHDVMGRSVLGFGGRALSDEDNPKYLNTGATPLYEKSKVLYNLNRARSQARDEGIVVTEGYMDVIGLAQHGVANAVATCGTALTPEHVSLIRSYTERVYLAFDADNAGRNAAWKACKLFLYEGIDARVVVIPDGLDPDEFVRNRGGVAWSGLLNESLFSVEFWLSNRTKNIDIIDEKFITQIITELKPVYLRIPNKIVKLEIVKQISDFLKIQPGYTMALLQDRNNRPLSFDSKIRINSEIITKEKLAPSTHKETYQFLSDTVLHKQKLLSTYKSTAMTIGSSEIEREVILRMLDNEEFLVIASRLIEEDWFYDRQCRHLFTQLLFIDNVKEVVERDENRNFIAQLYASQTKNNNLVNTEQLLIRFQNYTLTNKINDLIAKADKSTSNEDYHETLEKIVELKSKIKAIEGINNIEYTQDIFEDSNDSQIEFSYAQMKGLNRYLPEVLRRSLHDTKFAMKVVDSNILSRADMGILSV